MTDQEYKNQLKRISTELGLTRSIIERVEASLDRSDQMIAEILKKTKTTDSHGRSSWIETRPEDE